MDIINWTAIGAIGQILCAIATFWAVKVALKPYRKKVIIRLESVKVIMGEEETTIPTCVCIRNDGAKPIRIKTIGVKEKFETTIIEGDFYVEEEGQTKIQIGQKQLLDSFFDEKDNAFSVFVYDSKGNYYTSPRYSKQAFAENETIKNLFL